MSDDATDTRSTPDEAPPLGDMDPAEFRRVGHQLIDWIGRYLEDAERYPVLSRARPGDLCDALPSAAPERGESMDAILADVERHIVPGLRRIDRPDQAEARSVYKRTRAGNATLQFQNLGSESSKGPL